MTGTGSFRFPAAGVHDLEELNRSGPVRVEDLPIQIGMTLLADSAWSGVVRIEPGAMPVAHRPFGRWGGPRA